MGDILYFEEPSMGYVVDPSGEYSLKGVSYA
jgi:hypothetical protein